MKELSIEQKAKRYDEALGKARDLYLPSDSALLEEIFPELIENDDEKIREEIINYLECQSRDEPTRKDIHNKWIAWLEKQGQTFTKEDTDNANKVEPKDYNSIDPHFGKPAGKVEPKFKVGDWVVKSNVIAQILDIQEQYYVGLDIDGNDFTSSRFLSDDKIHLWDITKDAKEGDVLFQDLMDGKTFIYNGVNPDMAILYSFIISNDGKEVLPYHIGKPNTGIGTIEENKNIIHPATKEQRDTLTKAMADAGWEFDFEKK